MSEIQYNQSASTFSQVFLTGVGAVLLTQMLQHLPTKDIDFQKNISLFQKSYSLDKSVPTYNSYASIMTGEYISAPREFEQSIGNFYARLLTNQEPLGAEFEKVLHENLWDLYES